MRRARDSATSGGTRERGGAICCAYLVLSRRLRRPRQAFARVANATPSPYPRPKTQSWVGLLLLLALPPIAAASGRHTVCTVAFHGPEEIGVVRRYLGPPAFDVVSLEPSTPERARGAWLRDACRTLPRCDVVVLSGEFGGRFFGSYGFSLGLAELDEAACDPACAGIFRAPREVFLLACNTLATKNQDDRTPREYLRVLQDHGFDQGEAERVVQMRYGPVGPSFRESIRRAFMDVPRIYGFASVAPRGITTRPMLERYFDTIGDYAAHLERAGSTTARNDRLARAFAGTSLVQTAGLAPGEPGTSDRDLVCRLYDDGRSVVERLRTAATLMRRPDFLAFLPTLEAFLQRHPAESFDSEERTIFDAMRATPAARDQVIRLAQELDISSLKLEVTHFALHMGWMTAEAFRRLAIDGAQALLERPLTSEIVDIECEIARHEPLGDVIDADRIRGLAYTLAEGIRMIDCLAPKDPRVSTRLASALDSADASTRAWAAYALSRRLPLDEAILMRLAGRLGDESAEVRERVRWIFTTERSVPVAVRALIDERDAELAARLGDRRRRW